MRSGKHYKKIITPDGRKMDEHRYKMEVHLGRKLSRFELVHHKDEDITNNDINNLEVMTLSAHTIHHMKGRKTQRRDKVNKVISIKEKFLAGATLKELAKEYNVHYSAISLIVTLKSYAHIDKDGLNKRLMENKRPAQLAKLKH